MQPFAGRQPDYSTCPSRLPPPFLHARPPHAGSLLQQCRGLLWSVEREKGHTYKDPGSIINETDIHAAMEKTQAAAKDKQAIQAILDAAKERSFLTNYTPGAVMGADWRQGVCQPRCTASACWCC